MSVFRFEIKTASREVQARGRKFITRERGEWVGVGTEEGKEDRAVHFEGSKVECFSMESGEQCSSNKFHQVCSHVWAADRAKRINAKRRATRARNRQQHQVAA